jgi:hypothetical protein
VALPTAIAMFRQVFLMLAFAISWTEVDAGVAANT